MKELELMYRGSLRSCNYQCSYCPFSKRRSSDRELLKDREQWTKLLGRLEEGAEGGSIRSFLLVPYGEALLHPWYWEGLARISRLPGLRGVGAQTNGSFPVENSLELFCRAGGDLDRLRLWISFHPEMTSVEEFVKTCRQLHRAGVRLCVGGVGVPENLPVLKKLRRELPEELYLWINRMDGMRRAYTEEEAEAFRRIDPYFPRELAMVPADPEECQNRRFLTGDGRVEICNVSHKGKEGQCVSKRCSCYLAYGGRAHFMNRILFGPEPVFRIPRRAKAVFLDICGTLLPGDEARRGVAGPRARGRERIPGWVRSGLEGLKGDGIPLFFATTLPYGEAKRRCREIWPLFSGGVFAGGGHVVIREGGKVQETYYPMDRGVLSAAGSVREIYGGRLFTYRSKAGIYKVTLVREHGRLWGEAEVAKARELLLEHEKGIRVFAEGECLEIVAEETSKAEGVRRICRQLGIRPEEAAGAGDGAEDQGMMELFQESGL